jgi:PAS domain S-box-containing protein
VSALWNAPPAECSASSITSPFLAGGAEMGARMRAHDWSATPLGDPSLWPPSLSTTIGILLNSGQPMCVAWGAELTLIYNDAYAAILGARHPAALGRRLSEVWSDVWRDIASLVDQAMAGEPTWSEELHLAVLRHGFPQDTWWRFSYTTVRDESGGVGGLLIVCSDSTSKVLTERRQAFRIMLDEALRGIASPREVMIAAAGVLGRYLRVGRCGYGEIDETGEFLTVEHEWTDGQMPSAAGHYRIADYGYKLVTSLRAGHVVRVDDVCTDARVEREAVAARLALGIHAALAVPLIKTGRFAALLYAHRAAAHRWTDEEEGLIHEVAERTWEAVERARAEEALRRSEHQQALLLRLMEGRRHTADPEVMMMAASEAIGRHLQVDRVGFFEVREDQLHFTVGWTAGALPLLTASWPAVAIGTLYLAEVQAGRTLAIVDSRTDPLTADSRFGEIGIVSGIGAPIIRHGRWHAGFYVNHAEPRAWTDDEIRLVRAVADQTWDAIERARAEAALRESEERFRTIFEQANDFIFTTDLELRITSCNPAVAAAVGYGPEEIVGRSISEFISPGQLELTRAMRAQKLRDGGSTRYEVEVTARSGRLMIWQINSRLTLGPLGTPTGLHAIGRDVTEERQARDALHASEQRLREASTRLEGMLSAAEIGAWVWDFRTNRVETDSNFARLYELTTEEVRDATPDLFLQHVHPDDREYLRAVSDEALRSGALRTDAFRIVRPDGSVRWVMGRGKVHYDECGKPLALPGLVIDITERMLAEHERQIFLALAQKSGEFIGVCDLEGVPFFVSDAGLRLVGLDDLEQARHTPIMEFFFPEDREFILHEFYPRVLREGQSEVEIRFRHFKSGEPLWMIYNVFALTDVRGQAIGLGTVSRDITARKQAEDALHHADQRKDEFLAMLAHELRNPLAPVRTAAQVLKLSAPAAPCVQQMSDIIVRQVEHMTKIVDDLLDVSRVTRGLIHLSNTSVDLREVIGAAVEQCRPMIESHRHRLSLDVPNEPMRVRGDDVRLVQIVGNLLSNAAKYSDYDRELTLSVEHEPHGFVLHVRDEGIGISPALLPHVFDLFTQADRSAARTEGGLGLGLALVKRLVELHGGTVEARSEGLGRGSEFIVRLPADTSAAPDDLSLHRGARASEATGLSLMILDDNKDAADVLATLLELEGHRVLVETDACAALERARDEKPQVMVLDIGLPTLDGYELARRLRQSPETASATLIALTGYGREEDRRRSLEAGFDHHLVKPVAPEKLSSLLSSLVRAT